MVKTVFYNEVKKQAFDAWVENEQQLQNYFVEAKWVIDWLD